MGDYGGGSVGGGEADSGDDAGPDGGMGETGESAW